MLLGKLFHKAGNVFYFIFRIFVGFLFFQHGAQKLLGWFTDNDPVALFSLMGAAGLIESIGGLFIILGLISILNCRHRDDSRILYGSYSKRVHSYSKRWRTCIVVPSVIHFNVSLWSWQMGSGKSLV